MEPENETEQRGGRSHTCLPRISALIFRMSQNKLRRYVRALLYPVSGGRPRTVLLPVVSRIDDPTVPVWSDDLDLREWFPFGFERDRLSYFPLNPQHSLMNHYSIFTGANPDRLAPNDCLNPRWGLDVSGNVVVVRHARANLMRVTNIHAVEYQLVNFLITRWAVSRRVYTFIHILIDYHTSRFEVLGMHAGYNRNLFSPPPSV